MSSIEEPQDRKRQLIAAGSAYRKGMAAGREQVRASLQAESLASRAVSQLAKTAVAAFRSRGGKSSGVQALLPLAMSGISFLARKRKSAEKPAAKPGRPLVRKVLIAGALGAVAALFAKRTLARRRTASNERKRQPNRRHG